jgi:glutathione S-transferase
MELLGYYESPFVRRVGVTLHLYGLPFAHRPLRTLPDGDEIRARNPLGRIPALVLDGGEVLIDSFCIIDWLDEQAGARALVPRAGAARRQVNRLVALAHGAAEKYVAAYYERHRRPETHVWPPWRDRLEGQAVAGLSALEAAMQGPWLLGEAMTHADVATACAVLAMRADMPHLAPPGRFLRLDALVRAAEALPAFAATRPA